MPTRHQRSAPIDGSPATITIGIPTAGRPAAIAACLESIERHVRLPYRVLVADSGRADGADAVYADRPHVEVLRLPEPVGPSEARLRIAERASDPFLLYLDDDNLVTPGAVELLLEHLERHPEVGIAAGRWREDGTDQRRALGQFLHFGTDGGDRVVFRDYLTQEDADRLGLTSYRVDGCQATMLVRRAVLDVVAFDPRYAFFYEMLDLFLQCREQGVGIDVLPGAVFEHRPMPYAAETRRDASPPEDDEHRFQEKWGLRPLRFGRGPRALGTRRSANAPTTGSAGGG